MGFYDWMRLPFTDNEWNLIQLVCANRPSPKREYDQIGMRPGGLIATVKLLASELASKKIVFVGDRDGLSLALGLFAKQGVVPFPEYMLVLDFDERVINSTEEFAKQYQFDYLVSAALYNVKWPVPENFKTWADFFISNPVYSSKTEPPGLGAIIFVDRALDICAPKSSGSIILPYDPTRPWTLLVTPSVEDYLVKEVGCYVREMVTGIHSYFLDDDPNLRSGIIIVDRVKLGETRYRGGQVPPEHLANFYGSKNEPLPEYLDQEGNPVYKKPVVDYNKIKLP